MSLDIEEPILEIEKKIAELKKLGQDSRTNFNSEIMELERRIQKQLIEIYAKLSAWEILQIARHPKRPVLEDYIQIIFRDFTELHGDRCFGDDRALIGGLAYLDKHPVMLIGHNKGKNTEQNIERNFGMARPEGYRKTLRLIKLAEKMNIPVISFIDTSGAFPGLDAEERGQAEAIGHNLTDMAISPVPIIAIVTGEGGSGGALGIGVADVVMMLSFAVYSVISPEGCASILWRDAKYAPEAAEALKITAKSLLKLGVIQEIVEEPAGGAHRNHQETANRIKKALLKHLVKLKNQSPKKLLKNRMENFRNMGRFQGK